MPQEQIEHFPPTGLKCKGSGKQSWILIHSIDILGQKQLKVKSV